MYTLEECAAYWEETGKHGTKEERIVRGKTWHPYYGYIAQKQLGKPWTPDPNTAEIVDFLRSEGVIAPHDHVLDIGAGMGGYALEIARHCRKVTAIDNSPECIAVIEDKVARSKITNVSTRLVSWEEFTPEEKYDVTFSSMCPAICNLEELRRMEAMTNRSCCLIAVTRGSYDKHRMRMMRQLQLKSKGGMTTEALHYINVLYLLGRQPNVRCITRTFTRSVPVEAFREQYANYFPIFGMSREETERYLDAYIAENAVDGQIKDESRHNLAVITWSVPKEGTVMAELESILRQHAKQYPLMQPTDAVKLIYQNEFGGGHLIKDKQTALDCLRREYESIEKSPAAPLYEYIGNGIVRVNLAAVKPEDLEQLGMDFIRSAGAHKGTIDLFLSKLAVLKDLTNQGVFAFGPAELAAYLTEYEKAGYPVVSHSQVYRQTYLPAYRVVKATK